MRVREDYISATACSGEVNYSSMDDVLYIKGDVYI